jgi:molybdopterin-guanine dinucleotide biosynthesis protein A
VGVAALLLTGGAGRRFGSAKAEIRVAGERLADRNARVLSAVADPVLEVGPGWSSLTTVHEDEPGAGPLAAVAAGGLALAARGAGDGGVVVAAVDLPFLDAALLALLVDLASAPDGPRTVVPRVDGRPQPLCACYSPSALARAAELVQTGERSMRGLLTDLGDGLCWVDEADWGAVTTARGFSDVDTPDDALRLGLEPPG